MFTSPFTPINGRKIATPAGPSKRRRQTRVLGNVDPESPLASRSGGYENTVQNFSLGQDDTPDNNNPAANGDSRNNCNNHDNHDNRDNRENRESRDNHDDNNNSAAQPLMPNGVFNNCKLFNNCTINLTMGGGMSARRM